MRLPTAPLIPLLVALTLVLAGCSDSDSETAAPPATSASASASPSAAGTVCEPVAGEELVALEDDESLQASDNIIPVVRTAVLTEPLREALEDVSEVLTQEALNGLNRSTDIDRVQPAQAAADFVEQEGLAEDLTEGSGPIRVVAANFSENQTLANVYAEVLNAAGFDATVVQLTNREVYEAALEAGDVDVVAEYAATLTTFLANKANPGSTESPASGDIDETVAALTELATPRGLTPLTPAEATDQNAFAVTKAFAEKYAVDTLSDLAETCSGGVSLGGPPECPQRPFCQPGLEETYGLNVSEFTALDAGGPLSKNALRTGVVAVALVFSSDASLVEQA